MCWHGHGVERQVKTLATAKTIFKTALTGEIRRQGGREREREGERERESERERERGRFNTIKNLD